MQHTVGMDTLHNARMPNTSRQAIMVTMVTMVTYIGVSTIGCETRRGDALRGGGSAGASSPPGRLVPARQIALVIRVGDSGSCM